MNDPSARGDGRARRRTGRWLLFNVAIPLAILSVGVVVVVLLGEAKPDELPAEDGTAAGRMKRLPPAQVTTVRSLDEFGGRLDLSVDGVVVPFREVQLASEVSGRILWKDPVCEAGNRVQQGQLLFRIDPTDYRLEVERLARLRDQEYEALKELDQETANAQRLLEVATQELDLRQRELKRLQSLPGGFASQTELDQAERARLQALQAQVSAENQRDLLLRRRGRLEAAERLAASQLEAAEVNLARTDIRAPISGVIVREDAELNSFIQRGMPVITIEDTSAAEVAVSLRMDQLYWVLDQQRSASSAVSTASNRGYELPETPATIYYEMAGRQGAVYQWQGTLLRYHGIGLDEQTRTVPVRIVVDQTQRVHRAGGGDGPMAGPQTLVRGMFVRVVLHIDPRTPLVVVPALALKPGNRMWRFQPDATVLAEPSTIPPASAAASSAASPPTGTAPPRDEMPTGERAPIKPFKVSDWVPGSVKVLENVRPIETARKLAPEEGKYWICEVPAAGLVPGDYVIVSPLAAVGKGASDAARVPVRQIKPTDVPETQNIAAR